MSNMGYCRFENTYKDLKECDDHMSDTHLSESEQEYRKKIIKLCISIVEYYGDEFNKEVIDIGD